MLWVVRPGCARLVVKRSVFTGAVVGIAGVDDLPAALSLAGQHVPDAGHYAFALRGRPGEEQASDAGEPSGTAGRPLLQLLRRRDVEHAIVIVARFYGGVNLGRPGLFRAYLGAGEEALSASGLEEPLQLLPIQVRLRYDQYGSFQHQFPELVNDPSAIRFTDVVEVTGLLPVTARPRLETFLNDRGMAAHWEVGEPFYSTRSPQSCLEWPTSNSASRDGSDGRDGEEQT